MRKSPKCELDTLDLPAKRAATLVWLTDKETGIRIAVLPAAGGEIASFQARLGGKWREILYRALDYRSAPPDGWDGRAPLLWPAVGRSFTDEQIAKWKRTGEKPTPCRYSLGGKSYNIPSHGFARNLPWELGAFGHGADSAWVICSLTTSAATRKMYPFDFALSVRYTLARGSITLRYEATAGDNPRPMPFAIGNHISFRMPFTGKGRFEDCSLRTPACRMLLQNEFRLLSGRSARVNLARPTPLSRSEFLDAVLGGYLRNGAWLELADPASLTLRVSHEEKSPGGKFFARERDLSFVFWGTPLYRYFCPEPWIGLPNALNTGRGVGLPAGETFAWEICFTPLLPGRHDRK